MRSVELCPPGPPSALCAVGVYPRGRGRYEGMVWFDEPPRAFLAPPPRRAGALCRAAALCFSEARTRTLAEEHAAVLAQEAARGARLAARQAGG